MSYYENPAISASGLKQIARSPAHFITEREPTDSMKFGSAAHCAILEAHDFDNRYAIVPEGIDYRSKEGKEIKAAIEASGKEPIKFADAQDILALAKAVRAHPKLAELLELNPEFEKEFFFNIDDRIPAKMKMDLVIMPRDEYPNGLIVDVKSCPDASPEGFARGMWNMKGFIQSSFYTKHFQKIHDTPERPPFLWLAAERKPPYLTAIYSAPQHLLEYSDTECDRLLKIYEECMHTGAWRGYDQSVTELMLPMWAETIMSGGDSPVLFDDEGNEL